MSSSRGFILILLLILVVGSNSQAKQIDLNGKFNATLVIGVGAGPHTYSSPEHAMDANNCGSLFGALEMHLLGPVHFVVGAAAVGIAGNMNYDYTASDATHYTGQNIPYNESATLGRAGLQFRLINASAFHFFIEGGAFMGGSNYSYTIATDSTVYSQGTTFQSKQKNVWTAGSYADAGIDLMPGKWGIRFAGRVSQGHTGVIHAIGEKRLKYVESMGYVALIFRP